MLYLSVADLTAINEVVVELTGGHAGVRDLGLVESAAFKPQASFGGSDLYPDIHLKAAVLFEALVNYHPCVDGNKRTGVAALGRFLALNDYELTASNSEIENYTLEVAATNPELADIAVWVRKHSQPVARS